ncbi:MAG: HAMP domain-containing sensor histidine kinase [Bacillota bacterium]|nr:HAMP domain-containing sensor histidine kinase [Bacillota bacterium]
MRRSTLARLEEMLERAIDGTFREEDYDESRLSRLETKWKKYLAMSQLAKRRAEKEQQMTKTLISDISHQTRTPIANILLYAELLQEKEKNPELTPIVENIKSQSEKLDFLIRSLMKASRLESELLLLHPDNQLIRPTLMAAIETVSKEALKKQIGIKLMAEDERACFDRKWTEEAISNLLDNAVKYSPCGSRIRVSVTEYEMFAAVHVQDQGIGIREEEQAQIFERFYRSRDVAGEKGVGIGLYLVREIAGKQGGYVKLKSVYGSGSVFSFYMLKNEMV